MNENQLAVDGRRVPKTWTLPLPMVLRIEKEAKERQIPESRVVEGFISLGMFYDENPVVEDFARRKPVDLTP